MRLPKDYLANMPTGLRKAIETLKDDIRLLNQDQGGNVWATHLVETPTADFHWESDTPTIYVFIAVLRANDTTPDDILAYHVFANEYANWREVAYVDLQTKPPFHTPEIWRQGRQVLFRAEEPSIIFPLTGDPTSFSTTFIDEIRRDQEFLTVERQQQFIHELAGEAAKNLATMVAILKHEPEYTRDDLAIALGVYLVQLGIPDGEDRPPELPTHIDELVKATAELYLYDIDDETDDETDPQESEE